MMIEGSKQQQLTFDKGITNVPSDALCSDNALAESVGMVYDDGEHKVIQKPVLDSSVDGKLLFIHKIPGGENKIVLVGSDVKYNTTVICAGDADTRIAAVGKTLIINTNSDVYYALWKNTRYIPLGNRLPEVELRFSMTTAQCKMEDLQLPEAQQELRSLIYATKTVGVSDVIDSHEEQWHNVSYWWHNIMNQEEFNNALIGIVSAHLNDVKKAKRFCFPFWVRYAIRLYDGSYTAISNPILMMPSVHHNCNAYISDENGDHRDPSTIWDPLPLTYDPYSAALKYQITTGIGNGWDDIVKGVDIFVSQEIRSFDLEGNWGIMNPYGKPEEGGEQKRADTVIYESVSSHQVNVLPSPTSDIPYPNYNDRTLRKQHTAYCTPTHWSDSEMRDRLLDASTFYKLFEIELDDAKVPTGVLDATDKIDTYTLPNLTTQTQLGMDDYYSHTQMTANIMKTYNSRLHLADITRSFFNGFRHFSNAPYGSQKSYTFEVYISVDDGDRIVKKEITNIDEEFRYWFYYPDPRAYKVEIYRGNNYRTVLTLKEHPHLNGAYALTGLPHGVGTLPGGSYSGNIPTPSAEDERITNRVFVSETNNPFTFTSKGDVTVGSSLVKGIATQTMALGQEEHGIHPLTVFTEEGIYALKLNSEGVYVASDIFSREVCNNSNAIIETDGAVFFPSEKGLMVVVGSQVKCVSEQLSGKSTAPFQDYLKDAFIAYDYRDSLLWIFDGASHIVDGATVVGSRYCYVYSIKSGTFGRYDFGQDIAVYNVVNSFPDSLLQIGNNQIYSLLERPNINKEDSSVTYTAHIVTRPMKLENALALKSIMQIRHIHDMEGSMTMRIYASNDLGNWAELHSLGGVPWKYYKFEYNFTGLKATDRFAGTMLITHERRTNKLR